jgi:hypothetical protein
MAETGEHYDKLFKFIVIGDTGTGDVSAPVAGRARQTAPAAPPPPRPLQLLACHSARGGLGDGHARVAPRAASGATPAASD